MCRFVQGFRAAPVGLLLGALATLPWGGSAQARDDDCGRAGKPWVSVAFAGDAWTAEMKRTVLTDLRAELSLQGFSACTLGHRGSQPPLALIEITAAQSDRVRVVIGVHDALTEKRVVRDLDLAQVSDDGRGLAVAVAADELLRASWAELTLEDAPEPAMEPPPEVESTLEASIAPRFRRSRSGPRLGARFALDYHGGGQTWLGGDAVVGVDIGEHLTGELRVGARDGLSVDADNGRVDSRAFVGAAVLGLKLWSRGQDLELTATAAVAAAGVELQGRADSPVRASDGAGLALEAQLGGTLALRLVGPLQLRIDAAAGAPLRSVEAVDAGRVASATSGLAVQAGLGLGVRL